MLLRRKVRLVTFRVGFHEIKKEPILRRGCKGTANLTL